MNSVRLMLDSGAYSAWRQRTEVDFGKYIEFIHRHADLVDSVVNLDKIPAEFGRVPTADEVEQSAAIGRANFKQLQREGIKSIPVFHQGEDVRWLQRMIDDGCDYIGISPANDRTTKQKIEWLDEIFGMLCGSDGFTKIKTHGFGVTAMEILYRYPWFSVDSATWFMVPAYGGILVPALGSDGIFDFTRVPQVYAVSRKAPASAMKSGTHWEALGQYERQAIEAWLRQLKLGNVESMRDDYKPRTVACAAFFRELMQMCPLPRFVQRKSLFAAPSFEGASCTAAPWPAMRVIFTMTISEGHNACIRDAGCYDRLMTHYYLDPLKFDLRRYVQNDEWITIGKKKNGKGSSSKSTKVRRARAVIL